MQTNGAEQRNERWQLLWQRASRVPQEHRLWTTPTMDGSNGHPAQQYQPLPPQIANQIMPYQGGTGTQVLTYVPTPGPYGPPPPPPPHGSYMAFPIVATGLATRRLPNELHVSDTLPHIRLPLGTTTSHNLVTLYFIF
jgi:hypothetical protein